MGEAEVINDVEVEERRRSLFAAKERAEQARIEHAALANVFAKEGADKVKSAGQEVQLSASKKWYNFWEKATVCPKELTTSTGQTKHWSDLSKSMLKEVTGLVEGDGFGAPSKKGGASVEISTEKIEKGIPMVRATKDVAVAPRAVLLGLIRAQLNGMCEPSLLYKREHYTFFGGHSQLYHVVKSFGPSMVAIRDFTIFQTWEEAEDGTITFAAKSVEGVFPDKVIPGAVRGSTLLFGVKITPKEVETSSFFSGKKTVEGAQVTVLHQTLIKGMVPNFLVKTYVVGEAVAFLNNIDAVAKFLENEGKTEEYINKYVIHADEEEEEQAGAGEAESPEN